MAHINQVLKEVLNEIKIPDVDLKFIKKTLDEFLDRLNKKIKDKKISAEVFVGGSFAKQTMMKKGEYDIDIFVRYDKKYKNEEISEITKNLLKNIANFSIMHGSRDYFRIKIKSNLIFEIIPVKKINSSKEAENITDLSYSHVKYIKKKTKQTRPSVAELKKTKNKRKILDEILLAKAFCYANKYYGAESHIKGFSGYSLELLVYHYKSFLGFIRAVSKIKKTEIIDIEKYYKNKNSVLMDLNSAKLQSPMILVDPTYKQRNVLAVLSHETFKKFQDDCRVFLKNPKKEIFVRRKTDFNLLIKNSKTKKHEFILIEIKTDKKEESIAGSKLLKFFNYLNNEIGKKFEIRNKKFEYENGQTAKCFFSAVKIEKITITGPKFDDAENVKRFRKKHKKTFIKNKRIYSEEKPNLRLSKFIENWNQKNKKQMKDMHITNIRILL